MNVKACKSSSPFILQGFFFISLFTFLSAIIFMNNA